jgi:hypothetical protein
MAQLMVDHLVHQKAVKRAVHSAPY